MRYPQGRLPYHYRYRNRDIFEELPGPYMLERHPRSVQDSLCFIFASVFLFFWLLSVVTFYSNLEDTGVERMLDHSHTTEIFVVSTLVQQVDDAFSPSSVIREPDAKALRGSAPPHLSNLLAGRDSTGPIEVLAKQRLIHAHHRQPFIRHGSALSAGRLGMRARHTQGAREIASCSKGMRASHFAQ